MRQSTPTPGSDVGRLELREMGEPIVLSAAEYVDWAPAVTTLIAHKVLTSKRSGSNVLIAANQLAGTARCPAGVLTIVPRFPEVVALLRRVLLLNGRSVEAIGYESSTGRSGGRDAVSAFLDATFALVDSGLPSAYVVEQVETSTLSGVLDVSSTVSRFTALGNHHRAVVRRTHLQVDHRICDLLAYVLTLLDNDLLISDSEAHLLSCLVEPLLEVAGELSTNSDALELLGDLDLSYPEHPEVLEVFALARLILEDRQPETEISYHSDVVSYNFVDTNGLWERAVEFALTEAGRAIENEEARLHPLRGMATPMFADGGPNLDPDVGAYRSGSMVAVVDAKNYSALQPDPGGVYQVYSYACSLGRDLACLFYLHVGDGWESTFGDSDVSIRSYGISTTPGRTLESLRSAAEDVWLHAPSSSVVPADHPS